MRAWYQKQEKALMIGLASILLSTFLMNLEFNFLESALYDARMRLGPQPAASSDIVIVALDDYSTSKLDEFSPLPLDQHVRFLELIEGYRPKAVGYLVDLSRSAQSFPESLQSEWSSRLISSASRLESAGAPFLLGTRFDVNGEVVPPYPLSLLPHAIAMIHKDGNVFGEDKVTRRALVNLYGRNSFHVDLARKLGLSDRITSLRGQFAEPGLDADYVFFRYQGNTQYSATQPDKNAYPVYSFVDVLDGKVAAAELAGKIILVGTVARDDSNDFTYTPYSKKPGANPKLIVHANVLDSVLNDRGLVEAPSWFHFLVTTALILFVIWSVFTYTPLYGVINTVALAIGFMAVGQILFMVRGLWIREAQPLIGIFLSYYLTVPYRLIQEYKQRWDYQRKNDILLQVEEMKTNFIRLVTHDLKTPVARIQGLAEMVLRKGSRRLEKDETENLRHIVESTDELNHFISSILELTKVESNRVTLT
ncbi:MAG: CHASE2 domain-containing protein, partial [Proteobacteria bacterium]